MYFYVAILASTEPTATYVILILLILVLLVFLASTVMDKKK